MVNKAADTDVVTTALEAGAYNGGVRFATLLCSPGRLARPAAVRPAAGTPSGRPAEVCPAGCRDEVRHAAGVRARGVRGKRGGGGCVAFGVDERAHGWQDVVPLGEGVVVEAGAALWAACFTAGRGNGGACYSQPGMGAGEGVLKVVPGAYNYIII